MSSSFVNIDLDEGKANQSVEDSTKDIPNEEVEQNDEPDMAQSVQENATPVLAEEGDKKTNEVLQRIGKQLIEDYYKYYHLNGSSQVRVDRHVWFLQPSCCIAAVRTERVHRQPAHSHGGVLRSAGDDSNRQCHLLGSAFRDGACQAAPVRPTVWSGG